MLLPEEARRHSITKDHNIHRQRRSGGMDTCSLACVSFHISLLDCFVPQIRSVLINGVVSRVDATLAQILLVGAYEAHFVLEATIQTRQSLFRF